MTVSVFDHPVLSGLLGDDEVATAFAFETELSGMLAFEMVLAQAEAMEGLIPGAAADAIGQACASFQPDTARLKAATARDGVMVPELVRQLRAAIGEPHGACLHVGTTSQDVADTGLVLRLRDVLNIIEPRLGALIGMLDDLVDRYGDRTLIGRTRMRRAVPITVGDRLVAWRAPLRRHGERLDALRREALVLQFGGAAGTLDRLGDAGPAVAGRLAEGLGLDLPERQWQTDRTRLADLAHWFAGLSGSLGKMGQDLALMAQDEIAEVSLSGGGASSAMPHKRNPVGAEALVALARFAATQVSGMHHALIHEQERSGAAWTLEWMILPPLAVTAGASLRTAASLLDGAAFEPSAG